LEIDVAKKGHVEIIGAGFGGLVTAIGLADRGWSVRVHERRSSLGAEGYGIAIQDNMARVFSTLGILDDILAGGIEIDRRDSLDGNGNLLLRLNTGLGRYRISRHHIISLLSKRALAAGVDILTGSNISGASEEGKIYRSDGKSWSADLIVAADGINSKIRESLDLTKNHILRKEGGVRVIIPRLPEEIENDRKHGTTMVEAWSGDRRILYCPNSQTELYVILTCMNKDLSGRVTPLDAESWGKAFPGMTPLINRVSECADWNESKWARFQTIRLKSWSTGRIALLGDAAHAMPPYLGQGAGHAMMNGLGLAVSVNEYSNIFAALDNWEGRERPLTEHTQFWTSIYGKTIFFPGWLKSLAIKTEKHLPWLALQYSRASKHIPTGCESGDIRT
jgi:2-polyprenyl-6-methoxyphenol hydroxylase-like FAD-dependent oxidoreductase|tara:strand:- start:19160 stop:20335 length:1176 start_codon:yes stop_codon:yes gene_type:complete